MSAYSTAVSEMSRDDLIADLLRHKQEKDAARNEGVVEGLRLAAEVAREQQTAHQARIATKSSRFDLGGEWAARSIAESTEDLIRERTAQK